MLTGAGFNPKSCDKAEDTMLFCLSLWGYPVAVTGPGRSHSIRNTQPHRREPLEPEPGVWREGRRRFSRCRPPPILSRPGPSAPPIPCFQDGTLREFEARPDLAAARRINQPGGRCWRARGPQGHEPAPPVACLCSPLDRIRFGWVW